MPRSGAKSIELIELTLKFRFQQLAEEARKEFNSEDSQIWEKAITFLVYFVFFDRVQCLIQLLTKYVSVLNTQISRACVWESHSV